jgi:hypothetical protein
MASQSQHGSSIAAADSMEILSTLQALTVVSQASVLTLKALLYL